MQIQESNAPRFPPQKQTHIPTYVVVWLAIKKALQMHFMSFLHICTPIVLMVILWMVSASHKDLHDNMCGVMQLEILKQTLQSILTIFVPVVLLAPSKYHPLLAVTTTVSPVILEVLVSQPFTLMMFLGMVNNVDH